MTVWTVPATVMGLDAAQKTESTGAVRFEVVGIDPADLS